MSVDVIIVNYNGGNCLGKCLDALEKVMSHDTNVYVVDNASRDGSAKFAKNRDSRFHLLELEENLGFAAANNRGAREGRGNIIHFLNPDTLCHANVAALYDGSTELDPVTLYVTELFSSDGKKYPGRHTIPFVADILHLALRNRGKIRYWAQGSSLVLQRSFFVKLGGWPEDYFMYAEDLDFSWLANVHGKGVQELSIAVDHIGEGVTSAIWSQYERERRKQVSTFKFYRKYHRMFDYFLVSLIHFCVGLFSSPARTFLVARCKLSILVSRGNA